MSSWVTAVVASSTSTKALATRTVPGPSGVCAPSATATNSSSSIGVSICRACPGSNCATAGSPATLGLDATTAPSGVDHLNQLFVVASGDLQDRRPAGFQLPCHLDRLRPAASSTSSIRVCRSAAIRRARTDHEGDADDEVRNCGGSGPDRPRVRLITIGDQPVPGAPNGFDHRSAVASAAAWCAVGARRPRRCSGRRRNRNPRRGRGCRSSTAPRRDDAASTRGSRIRVRVRSICRHAATPGAPPGSNRRSPTSSTVGRGRAPRRQQCPQPRDQHRVRERLGQVVVGAGVQPLDLVPATPSLAVSIRIGVQLPSLRSVRHTW